MQSWIFKFGALAFLAQTVAAGKLHIETTHPPANKYKSHCTVIFEDDIAGCTGSSGPFPGGCGDNDGELTAPMCGGTLTVNWDIGLVKYKDQHCTLNSVKNFGKCDTSDPDQYPVPSNSGNQVSANNALYGLAPLAAAGLLL